MSGRSYVCAFRGRRDDYQVPLALAENQRLDQFITDAYTGPLLRFISRGLPTPWQKKVVSRCRPEIPTGKVRCLWSTTAREYLHRWRGVSRVASFAHLDQDFSRAAERRARRMRSNLLLYTPYAWEAFTASYRHTPRKVLFQYHPHQVYETRLLQADVRKHPQMIRSFNEATGQRLRSALQERISECWRQADLILCASSFTKRTLLEAGAKDEVCRVVPYGIEGPSPGNLGPFEDGGFRVLFVGMGIQRKGLHHLLAAWRMARLPVESELVLVCRTLDPGLEGVVLQTPRTRLIRTASRKDLDQLYADSTLFVMPSLTEGFGQVYLEALSHGCPVLGTENTCLPDLGRESDGIFLVETANPSGLADRLEQLAALLPNQESYRLAAKECAKKFTWERFRDGVERWL